MNFYLVAQSGTNKGKWFKGSDQTWSATVEVAATGTYKDHGQWTADIHADAWVDETTYRLYASESGDLSVAYGYQVTCGYFTNIINVYDEDWSVGDV